MESNISFSRETFPVTSFQDGLILSVMTVIPEHPHAILQIAHGMCEHKERYLPFMEYMASQGFACIIHDHRGHGKSVKSQDDRRPLAGKRSPSDQPLYPKHISGSALLSAGSQHGISGGQGLLKALRKGTG